jgi:hypothetical protein
MDRNEASAEVAQLRSELETVHRKLDGVMDFFKGMILAGSDDDQLVDADQVAAMVHLTHRTIRRYLHKEPDPAPLPERPACRGRPALWRWQTIRPWLARSFGVDRLPERFPPCYRPGDEFSRPAARGPSRP